MKRPQMLKGQNPYTGPFWVIEVVSRYMYRLSDSRKWNRRRLKRYLPSPVEWTELALQLLNQPQGGVGITAAEEDGARVADAAEDGAEVADAAEDVARVADAVEDVAGVAVAEVMVDDVAAGAAHDDVAVVAENVPPGPIAIAPHQDAEVEQGTRYPRCDRCMPDHWSADAPPSRKRERKK